jgi:hypothetical protein
VRAKAAPNRQNKTAEPNAKKEADTGDDTGDDTEPANPKADAAPAAKDNKPPNDNKDEPLRLVSTFRETDFPGVYIVKMKAQDLVTVERWITFNVPNDESELELATTAQIRKQLDNNLSVEIQEPGQFSWIEGKDAGQEVRQWILILLIAFLLAEQFMGYRLSFHSRGGAA